MEKYLYTLNSTELRLINESIRDSISLRQMVADKMEPRYWDEDHPSHKAKNEYKLYQDLLKAEKEEVE
jgi:cellulose biosynthesis protein BcsQ